MLTVYWTHMLSQPHELYRQWGVFLFVSCLFFASFLHLIFETSLPKIWLNNFDLLLLFSLQPPYSECSMFSAYAVGNELWSQSSQMVPEEMHQATLSTISQWPTGFKNWVPSFSCQAKVDWINDLDEWLLGFLVSDYCFQDLKCCPSDLLFTYHKFYQVFRSIQMPALGLGSLWQLFELQTVPGLICFGDPVNIFCWVAHPPVGLLWTSQRWKTSFVA